MKYYIKSFIIIVLTIDSAYADCSDLGYDDCIYWSGYCEWNEETNVCQDAGGGAGGDGNYDVLTEADGIRPSDLYNGALLYYPTDGTPPYESIILMPAFGEASGMNGWAQFYASNGYIAMTIGNFDRSMRDWDSEWDYADRGLGMLDAMETIKAENVREQSPLYGSVDTTSFSVSGHSTSGGGAHTAAVMEPSIKSAILLNSAMAVLDSLNCPSESAYYCLIEEHLDHEVPTLVFAGQDEYDELVTPDDTTYGGGSGMLIKPDVLAKSLDKNLSYKEKIIYLSPKGKLFNQELAKKLSRERTINLICGHFEGVDQRVIESRNIEEVSIGDFILSGGEVATFVILDAILRFLPGVLGNENSSEEESFENGLLEYPQYTKPQIWEDKGVPDVLLSGDHAKIKDWRLSQSEAITRDRRPDLWQKYKKN